MFAIAREGTVDSIRFRTILNSLTGRSLAPPSPLPLVSIHWDISEWLLRGKGYSA